MEYTSLKPQHLQNVALSFSGGGFRASSYALGCLSYMDILKIEDKKFTDLIRFISSASGGSFTSMAYAVSLKKGESFEKFYKTFTNDVLHGNVIIDRVFEILKSDKYWTGKDKSRNIINAFSIAYDELIFQGNTFGLLYPKVNDDLEICINTTEFDNAMWFRFQNAGDVGNKFLKFKSDTISVDVLKKIKLSDILACSSCFPVGFEPFMFPKDFTYQSTQPGQSDTLTKASLEEAIKADTRYSPVKGDGMEDKQKPCFGIMDGGIDDNQGVGTFMLAEERLQSRNSGLGYDLYLSCDVSSNYTSGYDFPSENKKSWFLKPSLLHYLLFFLAIFSVSVYSVTLGLYLSVSYIAIGFCLTYLILYALVFIGSYGAYRKSVSTKNTYGVLILNHLWFFLTLRLSELLQILNSRATSAGYLAAVVFLKKIRRISYDRLYEKITEIKLKDDGSVWKKGEDPTLVKTVRAKHWSKFALQNAVYLFSPKNDYQRKLDLSKEPWYKSEPVVTVNGAKVALIELLSPTPKLQAVAELATEMDTTLWYDKNHADDKRPVSLLAAGQFTTCYNLIRYSFRAEKNDPYWLPIQAQLVDDWSKFNDDPYWMTKTKEL